MTEYKSRRITGWVTVDKAGNIINRSPTKDDLKGLDKEPRHKQDTRKGKTYHGYTNEHLLNCLIQFYEKYGIPPTQIDFTNNSEYPHYQKYRKRFGNWANALKLVGLDVDSMVQRGVLVTCQQKARLSEITVINHFRRHPIDLSGENQNSPCDGICPNGMNYDVKSCGLHNGRYYQFATRNKYKEEIEIYYFLAFNKDYTKLDHGWRVPGEIIEKDSFLVGIACHAEFNIKNMRKYDITDEVIYILENYANKTNLPQGK